MTEMDDYKKQAHAKYLAKIEKEHAQEQEHVREQEQVQEKKQLDDDFCKMIFTFINDKINTIKENINLNIEQNMAFLTDILCNNIEFIKSANKFDDVKQIFIKFVEDVNEITMSDKIDLKNLNVVTDNFDILFRLLEMDISIEQMDTSRDEQIAMDLQNSLNDNVT